MTIQIDSVHTAMGRLTLLAVITGFIYLLGLGVVIVLLTRNLDKH